MENDNASDARRKAMRNGEEDPITVAQRYLNIYRQIHIFSPERKESFDKMILELSPEVRSMFSRLPGGIMLQDYLDELAEKNGISLSSSSSARYDEYAQPTEIPVASAPVAPAAPVVQAAPVQAAPIVQTIVPQMGPAKISLDKDFAGEIGRIINDVMQKQSAAQKTNMSDLVENLTKTQILIAKNIKESQDLQKSEIATLCKILVQSHKALNTSFANMQQRQMKLAAENEITTKKLMSIVLDNQKQINLRLDKVGSLPVNSSANSQVSANIGGAEILAAIEQSQANLVKSIMGANLQQNNTTSAQANNNNIQINTPDTSAQTLMLLDKMLSMQQQNENNLANAITKAIEAQGELLEKISRRQESKLGSWVGSKFKFSRKKDDEDEEDTDGDVNDFEEYENDEEIFFEKPEKKKHQSEKNKKTEPAADAEALKKEEEKQAKISLQEQIQDIIDTTAVVDDSKNVEISETKDEEPDFDWDSLLKETEADLSITDGGKSAGDNKILFDDTGFSSTDWGFSESGNDDLLSDNNNTEGEDWEWAYVNDGEYVDEYVQGEAIGDNSYIYTGDLYYQAKAVGDIAPVYTPNPVEVRRGLRIIDSKEADFYDPYAK